MPTPEIDTPSPDLIERLQELLQQAAASEELRQLSAPAESPELWAWVVAIIFLGVILSFLVIWLRRKKAPEAPPTIPPYPNLLAALRKAETRGEEEAFPIDTLAEAIRNYIASLIPESRNATPAELRRIAPATEGSEDCLAETADLLEALDWARFAPPGGNAGAIESHTLLARLWKHSDKLRALEEAQAAAADKQREKEVRR